VTVALELVGASAGYGSVEVLHGVTMGFPAGSVVALVGRNGAGKTTALRCLAGLVPLRAGSVRHDGDDITRISAQRRATDGLMLVPDEHGVFGELTVAENLAVLGSGHAIDPVLELFPELAGHLEQPAATLSGGEQQMLALSRALMLRPKLLLLDEPSFGLAPLVVQDLFRIMRIINEEERVGMLLVEQNANLALDLADHAYLIETGRLVISGAAAEIRKDEAIRRSYLGY
jgi:branched-chain amino acid transport system ATP-binding protein